LPAASFFNLNIITFSLTFGFPVRAALGAGIGAINFKFFVASTTAKSGYEQRQSKHNRHQFPHRQASLILFVATRLPILSAKI
jgi:hypothetical protein